MATASQAPAGTDLQQMARRHLWMHFSRMGGYGPDHEIPIITRAEGCYVYDEHGNRYLDGLSGLFCVNAGHGRTEYGEAAARQVEELDFYTLWSYAHPRAIELASRIASLAPGDLNRVFFTSGGSEAVESALKLAAQLPPHARQRPEAQGDRPRGRLPRHLLRGALGDRDHRAAQPVRAADAGRLPRPEHEHLPLARGQATRSGRPTRSRSGSSSRGRRRSPR